MKYSQILERIAPCGLSCEKCFAFRDGDIRKYSRQLSEGLGDFGSYAQRFAGLLEEPVFNIYPYFKLQLEYFSQVSCAGCRKEHCKMFKSCRVRKCIEEKGVDFCFQCDKFPCRNTGFDESLETRWKKNNVRMKEVGVETYYEETKKIHRYRQIK
jgi:hypothetical protein